MRDRHMVRCEKHNSGLISAICIIIFNLELIAYPLTLFNVLVGFQLDLLVNS